MVGPATSEPQIRRLRRRWLQSEARDEQRDVWKSRLLPEQQTAFVQRWTVSHERLAIESRVHHPH